MPKTPRLPATPQMSDSQLFATYGDQVPQSLKLFAQKNQLGADELILSMEEVITASRNAAA